MLDFMEPIDGIYVEWSVGNGSFKFVAGDVAIGLSKFRAAHPGASHVTNRSSIEAVVNGEICRLPEVTMVLEANPT
jgi:hypothetical protein